MLAQRITRIAALALGVTLTGLASARAGMIHAVAGVNGSWTSGNPLPNDDGPFSDYWSQGDTSASASAGRGLASGFAAINLLSNPGFHFSAVAGSNDNTLSTSRSEAYTRAQWIDVIHVGGGATPPSQIRINVSVDGFVELSRPADFSLRSAEARFGVSEISGSSGLGSIAGSVPPGNSNFQSEFYIAIQAPPSYPNLFQTSNTQNFQAAGLGSSDTSYSSRVTWGTTFDLAYHPEAGGYYLNLVAGSTGIGYNGGDSSVNLLNTIRLTGVTLTDGSPITGDLTFDSGFRLSAVPEPSSIIMLSTGALALLGYGWRRRLRAQ